MSNAVIDCLMNHRSVRKYKEQPVDEATLDVILRAGVRAASAGNLQHYSLVVVDDPAVKTALGTIDGETVPYIVNAPVVIMAMVDEYRFKRWVELNDAPFYNHHIVNLMIGAWDAIVVLQNIVIAAESLGLGTVYVGMAVSMDVRRMLGVPDYVIPAGMVCMGYPDEQPDLRTRLPLEAVVHRNCYQIPTDAEIQAYHRERDASWSQLAEERRQKLEARGIHNAAQRVTVGHYTEEFLIGESRGIRRNIEQAGFVLEED
ncbi:MAG TPA: nitroreductase family protein [Aggregatilineaceae bacterium]|nr:nitroreductase family protein [Aggregatilineaceae bacterium]